MPTNLQLNKTCIQSSTSTSNENNSNNNVDFETGNDFKNFDTITFGVGTDHFQRKSKYGLLKYVIDQQPDCGVFDLDRFSPNMMQYFKLSELLQKLKQKKNLFDNRILTPSGDRESTA